MAFLAMKTVAVATCDKRKPKGLSGILAPQGWMAASIRDWLPRVPEPEETEPRSTRGSRWQAGFVGGAGFKWSSAGSVSRETGPSSLPDAVSGKCFRNGSCAGELSKTGRE